MNNLSTLIESLCSLKRTKKELEQRLKDNDKEIGLLEGQIMQAMDGEGVIESKNHVGKVTISESIYPHVEEWGQFGDYILDNRYLHLLERRPAVLAYRELLSLGREVPGVLPFTKRKLAFKES